jgi:hypothetical protein
MCTCCKANGRSKISKRMIRIGELSNEEDE